MPIQGHDTVSIQQNSTKYLSMWSNDIVHSVSIAKHIVL